MNELLQEIAGRASPCHPPTHPPTPQGALKRKQELTQPGRAEVGKLYASFLFPQLGRGGEKKEKEEEKKKKKKKKKETKEAEEEEEEEEEGEEKEETETLGALYLSSRTRSRLYVLLLVNPPTHPPTYSRESVDPPPFHPPIESSTATHPPTHHPPTQPTAGTLPWGPSHLPLSPPPPLWSFLHLLPPNHPPFPPPLFREGASCLPRRRRR